MMSPQTYGSRWGNNYNQYYNANSDSDADSNSNSKNAGIFVQSREFESESECRFAESDGASISKEDRWG